MSRFLPAKMLSSSLIPLPQVIQIIAKLEEEGYGLQVTQKLLANVYREIEALARQHS